MFRFYSGDRGEPPCPCPSRPEHGQDMASGYVRGVQLPVRKEMKRVMRIVERERLKIMRQWNDFFR